MRRLAFLLAPVFATAAAAASPAAAQQNTHVIIVSGIGGEPKYQQTFFEWGAAMAKAAAERYAVPKENIAFLAERPEMDAQLATGRSTKEEVEKAIAAVAGRASPDALVFLLLIGHGSYQGGESRINLPGPDLTAQDFAKLLDTLAPRRVVFVNVASASGEFVKAVSGPNRVVITATKSGMERDHAQFGKFFVAALTSDGADTDKDGAVSMLEAFEYAKLETARAYEQDRALQTEHAVFDDNGDGMGSTAAADGQDGKLARLTFLGSAAVVAGTEAPPGASPALRKLYDEKREIEKRIDALRALKETMEQARYEQELEKLLIELALKQQEIRRLEGGGSP